MGKVESEIQQRKSFSVTGSFVISKQLIGRILAIVALLGIMFFVPTSDSLSLEAKKVLAVAVFAIIVWATEAFNDAVSGLIIVFLLAALKATSAGDAFIGYSKTSLWLLVVGFIMAAGLDKAGLSKRIALHLISLAGGSAKRIYWAIATVMAILTFLVPSITARTMLMLPIILGIAKAFKAETGKSNIVKALFFIVAFSGTLMSIGVLTAHAANPVTVGLIVQATGENISWSEWFRVGGPPALVSGFLSVFLIQLLWPPEIKQIDNSQKYVREELKKMGQISRDEKYILLVFLLTLALWATDSIHGINSTVVGMVAVIFILWPGLGTMTWKEAQGKVPWNVFILYGAGLSMGGAMVSSGAANWLAENTLSPLIGFSNQMQLIILIWIVTVLQVFFTGGGPKTTALTPIILAHAISIGADPLIFALIMGMNMQHQYLLPVSNMPNAVIMGTGELKSTELIRTGAVFSIAGAAFFTLMVFTYWNWIGISL